MVRTVDPITEHQFQDGSAFVFLTDPENTERHQEFDPLFNAPLSIDIAHHEVHEGDSFSLFVREVGVADTETVEILIQAPAVASPQKRIHLIAEHAASTAYLFDIVSGATYSSGGAAATAVNRLGGSVKTTALQAAYTGTTAANIATGGTPSTIWGELLGAGKTAGGGSRGVNEWILEPNQSYLFKITSAGGGGSSCNAFIGLIWYEHTDSL